MKNYVFRFLIVFSFFSAPFLMGATNISGGGCDGINLTLFSVSFSGSHVSFGVNSPQSVAKGETFSLTVTADTGYVLSTTVGGTCPAGSWAGNVYTTGIITSDCALSFSATNPNAPWYPSLNAFEHYDSGRSHLFSQASFAGNFTGGNSVDTLVSSSSYPSIYNMTYLDANQVFAYGGGYGNVVGSIGAFVAKINPETLAPLWYTQLTDTQVSGEWDYPGVMGILEDGYLYVIYGYRLSKINPNTGAVIATLELPSGSALPENTAYNGFNATPEGLLVMKAIYRQAGCAMQGPAALTDCPDPTDVPSSILVSVNPQTMKVMSQITLANTLASRVTVGTYNQQNYVYLVGSSSWLRYSVSDSGEFSLDSSWNPGTLLLAGQTPGSTLVVMNDWIIGQSNASPAATELSVIAVNQGNAQTQFSIQPFVGDPIPPLVATAFSFAAPGGVPAISWMPAPVSADPETNIVYMMDALPGVMSAYTLSSTGFNFLWKATQTTTENIAIIGSQAERIIVGTDIPGSEIPGANPNDFVVWRNAATGAEIARSPLLPQITSVSMVQPYYSGNLFYPEILGTLYQLIPVSN